MPEARLGVAICGDLRCVQEDLKATRLTTCSALVCQTSSTTSIRWCEWQADRLGKFRARIRRAVSRGVGASQLMVGLTYLKHCYNLSDEQVCERWLENPYWQFFYGLDYLQHRLPIDPSSLTRWRERIGASGMERLLAATIDAALEAGAVKPSSLERVTIGITVQPKAIAFPTDSRLYHRGREILVRLTAKRGIRLRQSYHRLTKRALRLANRYAHARQMMRSLGHFLGELHRFRVRPAVLSHGSDES
jgi:IS5 family transposase